MTKSELHDLVDKLPDSALDGAAVREKLGKKDEKEASEDGPSE